jgi:glycine/D-amino acid oxidase-like deaminating enzyme
MTVSHWRRTNVLGEIHCDALVVGAGVCGVSAALHLQRRGLDVRVVERDHLCAGASGRNAGFLMRGAADNYAAGVKHFGRERTRALWTLTEENLAGLRREGIETLPRYQKIPSVLLALTEREHDELRESVDLMAADGFRVSWLDRGDDDAWRSGRVLGALVNPDDAACFPIELIAHLAATLRRPVHERQEVVDFSRASAGTVRVRTTDGVFVAPRVLVCTNAYGPLLFPELAARIAPRRGQMFAMASAAGRRPRLDASYYVNHGSEYLRQALDGTVVVGGCRTYHAEKEVGYEDVVTPWVQNDLETFAASLLNVPRNTLEITARWSGVMGFSFDDLPLVGPVEDAIGERGWDRRVWFCGAFTGHGMSMAFRTSELAVDAMLTGSDGPFPIKRARINEP